MSSLFPNSRFSYGFWLFYIVVFEILVHHVISASGIVELNIIEWIPNKDGLDCCQKSDTISTTSCPCTYNFKLCIGLRRTDCAFINHNFDLFQDLPLGAQPRVEKIPFTPAWRNTTVSTTVHIRHHPSKRTLFYFQEPLVVSPSDRKPKIVYKEFHSSKLSFSLQVKCSENFYGQDCGIFCPKPSQKDNFVCGQHGMACKKGWKGSRCQEPICDKPCANGKCIAPNQCSCDDGWRGPSCAECIPHEGCQNGYCLQPNTCMCRENWGGKLCDKMLDRCLEKPCKNGASCTTNGRENYYECKCTDGWTGENCTVPIPMLPLPYQSCTNKPCGSNGICIPTGPHPDDFYCQCSEGFFGPKCENPVIRHGGHIFHEMSVCKTLSGEIYKNGQTWTNLECQKCTCLGGESHCTKAKCQPNNCLAPRGKLEKPIMCPENQICFASNSVDCLKGMCDYPVGFCRPGKHAMVMDEAQKCREMAEDGQKNEENEEIGKNCGKMYLKMNLEKIPEDTSVEELCHHILITMLSENLENFGFKCERNDKNTDLVEVDMVSLLSGMSVDRIELFIKNKIAYNLTSSPILHAVEKVWLEDDSPQNEADNESAKNHEILKEVKSTNILVIVCILLLVLLILIFCSSQMPEYGCLPCLKKKKMKNQRAEMERSQRNRPIIKQNLKSAKENGLAGSIFSFSSRTPSLTLEHEIAQNLVNTLRQHRHHQILVPDPNPPSPPPAYDFIEPQKSSRRSRAISMGSTCAEIEMEIQKSSPKSIHIKIDHEIRESSGESFEDVNGNHISVV